MVKRILIYTNHYYPEQFKINEVVDWLSTKPDLQIRVITCIPNYPGGRFFSGYDLLNSISAEEKKNIKINRLPVIPRGSGNYFMLSLNYISYFISCFLFTIFLMVFKKKYDSILVHHTSPFLISIHPLIYGIFYRTKKYLWDLDIWPDTLESVNVIKNKLVIDIMLWFVKLIYSGYDKILVSSNSFISIVKSRSKKEVIYFPNWAEKELEENIFDKKHILNFDNHNFKIMYTGNIGYAQNFDALIKIIDLLRDENIQWVFVGGGRFKSQFIKLLSKKDLLCKCSFFENVSITKIPNYVKNIDAMYLSLNSSDLFNKTVPAKLQSYMALSKPVIGLISGEGAKIIKDANCGICSENDNFIELSKKILKLMNSSSLTLDKLGRNGRNFYDIHFSRINRKKQILSLFK